MTYDAILFDNDGVLVGRTAYDVLHEAAWAAFDAVGVENPDPDHVEAMVIGAAPDDVTAVCEAYGLSAAEFWAARDRAAFEAQREEIRAGRKALYDDFGTLRAIDAPMGIVSSNQQETVDFVLDHFGVGGQFETAYGREPTVESLRRKKPAAHYLERALSDLGVEPGDAASGEADPADRVLFVGDNESDVRAAENAGVDSAFIRRPHRIDHELSVEPTREIDDLHALLGLVA